jgi:type VI secretion system protein ImpH
MAPSSWRNGAALIEQLFAEPYRFDFFQAVRLLRWAAAEHSRACAVPARMPVGRDGEPQQEIVRFRALPSHAFPAGPIAALRPPRDSADERRPAEMAVAFFGMAGPMGVLPRHYTTLLIERVRAKDFALRDFLDLFHHRGLSLFYRAWEKYRLPFAYEQETLGGTGQGEDLFTRCLYCLIGMGTGGLRGRLRFDDEALLFYAGHFAHWPRSAVALESLLSDHFQLPVAVRQFQGQWLHLAEQDQSSLPAPRWPRGLHSRLGLDAIAGERVWDVEGKFRVALGPLYYGQFRRLMPCSDMLEPLAQMVRLYVGPHLEFDVQAVLRGEEVPWCRLGGSAEDPARLGWNTWVRSDPFQTDVYDAVFSLKV